MQVLFSKRQQAVLQPCAGQSYLAVGVGELLPIVRALPKRVVIGLHVSSLQHRQDYSCIFGVVLIPRAITPFPETSLRGRGDGDNFKARLQQPKRQRPMVVPRWFKSNPNQAWKRG